MDDASRLLTRLRHIAGPHNMSLKLECSPCCLEHMALCLETHKHNMPIELELDVASDGWVVFGILHKTTCDHPLPMAGQQKMFMDAFVQVSSGLLLIFMRGHYCDWEPS